MRGGLTTDTLERAGTEQRIPSAPREEQSTGAALGSALPSIIRVRELLEALGDALASWRTAQVEALHLELAEAVRALVGHASSLEGATIPESFTSELRLATAALDRCERLGRSMSELAGLHARALGETEGYDQTGVATASGSRPLLRAHA